MNESVPPPSHAPAPERVLHNIEIVAAAQDRSEPITRHQRALETVSGFLGRARSLYAIMGFVTLWMWANSSAPNFLMARAFDAPPFYWLQGAVGLSALLVTVTILAAQNRQGRLAEQRAHLDLQVNLLSEQKITKIVALIEELRRDMPTVKNRVDPIADAMKEAVDPHSVVSAIQEHLEDD